MLITIPAKDHAYGRALCKALPLSTTPERAFNNADTITGAISDLVNISAYPELTRWPNLVDTRQRVYSLRWRKLRARNAPSIELLAMSALNYVHEAEYGCDPMVNISTPPTRSYPGDEVGGRGLGHWGAHPGPWNLQPPYIPPPNPISALSVIGPPPRRISRFHDLWQSRLRGRSS